MHHVIKKFFLPFLNMTDYIEGYKKTAIHRFTRLCVSWNGLQNTNLIPSASWKIVRIFSTLKLVQDEDETHYC